MQLTDARDAHRAPGPRVLGPSLALELDWAVHAASADDLRAAHPELRRLYADHPALGERLRRFWDDGVTCRPELDVLAHHAGALEETAFAALRAAIDANLATLPAELPLTSETPQDRAAILARLAALSESARLRRDWFGLLSEVAAAIDDWWRTSGIPSVERVGAQWREELARGADWQQLVGTSCAGLRSHLPSIVARQREGNFEVLLAPCALFGKGLYLDLPGQMLVGFGVTGPDPAARGRTEQIARRLRAVADPTRLAILDHLAQGAASVTDIARVFALSQPTVSSHIRKLRDAGLLTAQRAGTRIEVTVDREQLANLGSELAGLGAPS